MKQRSDHPVQSSPYAADNGTPLFRHNCMYNITGSKGKKHHAKANVFQFPLKLAWAMTCHKMQGQTVKKGTNLVIHWHKRLPAGMAYVMMGRVEDVKNLYITGAFDEKKIRCDKKALQEALRLERISL